MLSGSVLGKVGFQLLGLRGELWAVVGIGGGDVGEGIAKASS